jgi:heptosyltransferase-1
MHSFFSRASLRHIVLTVWRFLLRTLLPKRAPSPTSDPKRILLINGAHMGDVVIATSLLPVLKSAYPGAEIGFLTASWAHPVVHDHPSVTYTHCIDHWRMNRGPANLWQKRLRYWGMRRRALKEIRALSYDVSIAMHPWRADFLPLTWQASIPVRAAFSGGPFAPLATAVADYPEAGRFIHQGECQAALLRAIGVEEQHLRCRRSSLAPSRHDAVSEVSHLLGPSRIDQSRYVVIHMGSGNIKRELPTRFWREMASTLSQNQRVLFTGRGARESANVQVAMAGLPNCVNACDQLSWDGFVAAIRHAETFYGVDSMAAHVAAAVGTKSHALFAGITVPARFRPKSENCTVWSNALPCSGCERQFGCAEMSCMQAFDPVKILQIQIARAA